MFYQYNHLGSPDYLKLERGTNFSFPLHLHQCFEIIAVVSGSMLVTVDDKDFLLKKDEAILIFPNQLHELKSRESEHILCIFSPKLVQAYTAKITDKKPSTNKFSPDKYLIDALKTLDASASFVEKKGILYSLCGQFDKTIEYTLKKSDSKNLLHKIFSYVEENFNEECSLVGLAKGLGYDYSYLSRYFKKIIGIPFNSYVTHYRLSHASYLMENTELSVAQCAFDSGFCSLRSFNRSFKENLKITPTQYRKLMQIQKAK